MDEIPKNTTQAFYKKGDDPILLKASGFSNPSYESTEWKEEKEEKDKHDSDTQSKMGCCLDGKICELDWASLNVTSTKVDSVCQRVKREEQGDRHPLACENGIRNVTDMSKIKSQPDSIFRSSWKQKWRIPLAIFFVAVTIAIIIGVATDTNKSIGYSPGAIPLLQTQVRVQFYLKLNMTYKEELSDTKSPLFAEMATTFCNEFVEYLERNSSTSIGIVSSCIVNSFRPGSVIVNGSLKVQPTVEPLSKGGINKTFGDKLKEKDFTLFGAAVKVINLDVDISKVTSPLDKSETVIVLDRNEEKSSLTCLIKEPPNNWTHVLLTTFDGALDFQLDKKSSFLKIPNFISNVEATKESNKSHILLKVQFFNRGDICKDFRHRFICKLLSGSDEIGISSIDALNSDQPEKPVLLMNSSLYEGSLLNITCTGNVSSRGTMELQIKNDNKTDFKSTVHPFDLSISPYLDSKCVRQVKKMYKIFADQSWNNSDFKCVIFEEKGLSSSSIEEMLEITPGAFRVNIKLKNLSYFDGYSDPTSKVFQEFANVFANELYTVFKRSDAGKYLETIKVMYIKPDKVSSVLIFKDIKCEVQSILFDNPTETEWTENNIVAAITQELTDENVTLLQSDNILDIVAIKTIEETKWQVIVQFDLKLNMKYSHELNDSDSQLYINTAAMFCYEIWKYVKGKTCANVGIVFNCAVNSFQLAIDKSEEVNVEFTLAFVTDENPKPNKEYATFVKQHLKEKDQKLVLFGGEVNIDSLNTTDTNSFKIDPTLPPATGLTKILLSRHGAINKTENGSLQCIILAPPRTWTHVLLATLDRSIHFELQKVSSNVTIPDPISNYKATKYFDFFLVSLTIDFLNKDAVCQNLKKSFICQMFSRYNEIGNYTLDSILEKTTPPIIMMKTSVKEGSLLYVVCEGNVSSEEALKLQIRQNNYTDFKDVKFSFSILLFGNYLQNSCKRKVKKMYSLIADMSWNNADFKCFVNENNFPSSSTTKKLQIISGSYYVEIKLKNIIFKDEYNEPSSKDFQDFTSIFSSEVYLFVKEANVGKDLESVQVNSVSPYNDSIEVKCVLSFATPKCEIQEILMNNPVEMKWTEKDIVAAIHNGMNKENVTLLKTSNVLNIAANKTDKDAKLLVNVQFNLQLNLISSNELNKSNTTKLGTMFCYEMWNHVKGRTCASVGIVSSCEVNSFLNSPGNTTVEFTLAFVTEEKVKQSDDYTKFVKKQLIGKNQNLTLVGSPVDVDSISSRLVKSYKLSSLSSADMAFTNAALNSNGFSSKEENASLQCIILAPPKNWSHVVLETEDKRLYFRLEKMSNLTSSEPVSSFKATNYVDFFLLKLTVEFLNINSVCEHLRKKFICHLFSQSSEIVNSTTDVATTIEKPETPFIFMNTSVYEGSVLDIECTGNISFNESMNLQFKKSKDIQFENAKFPSNFTFSSQYFSKSCRRQLKKIYSFLSDPSLNDTEFRCILVNGKLSTSSRSETLNIIPGTFKVQLELQNMTYKEEYNDSTSEEFRAFSKVFVGELYIVLKKTEAGRYLESVQVTSINPGKNNSVEVTSVLIFETIQRVIRDVFNNAVETEWTQSDIKEAIFEGLLSENVTLLSNADPSDVIVINTEFSENNTKLKSCGKQSDVVFVLDRSGSIGSSNYVTMKGWITKFVSNFSIGLKETLVGVVSFASDVRQEFGLLEHLSPGNIIQATNDIIYTSGGTAIELALNFVYYSFEFSEVHYASRVNASKVVILMTDGQSSDSPSIPANQLRMKGAQIVCIGIGSGVNYNQLLYIAGQNSSVFKVYDFNALNNVISIVKNRACDT